jgi:hypothetical protein
MQMKKLLFLMLMTLIFSCKKEKINTLPKSQDRFEFGSFYGECVGNCSTFYKYESGKLFPDNFQYGSDNPTYSNVEITDAAKIQAIKDLINTLPVEFDKETDGKVFGCPDCGDWGGYYLSYSKGSIYKIFKIDTQTKDLPSWMLAFQKNMATTLEKLK